jgi:hypothetical protein
VTVDRPTIPLADADFGSLGDDPAFRALPAS